MGVEPGVFSPRPRDDALRARLLEKCALPPSATLLVGVGRHAPEKRWPMVVNAVTAAAYHRPIGMVLLGDGRDRARVVRAIGHNPHIQLLAPVTSRPQLAAIMASTDVLVHGCESETFCMVGAEAKASGLPLIVPSLGGASDHLRGWRGEAYEAADRTSLATAILRVAAQVEAERGQVAPTPRVATMDQHFERLFAMFGDLGGGGAAEVRARG
jgi:alpha-1,6-mannosyltransferase